MLDQKRNPEESLRHRVDSRSMPMVEAVAKAGVIELHDLRTGPEVEVQRLEVRVVGLTEEITQLRNENQKLKAANQKLDADLREIRLLLSQVQIKELRELEKVNSWVRSLKMVL